MGVNICSDYSLGINDLYINNSIKPKNMKAILNFYKQLICKHDWRTKGFFSEEAIKVSVEQRCVKCKKSEFKSIIL